MSEERDVWILAVQREGGLEDVSLELISEGRRLADERMGEVQVVVIGNSQEKSIETLASYGADKVYFLNNALSADSSQEFYIDALSKFFEESKPEILLCGASSTGRDLAPRLAARLKTGLVSECVSLALNEEGLLLQTKLTHGSKISSTIICPNFKPQMATVRPGIMAMKKAASYRKAKVMPVYCQIDQKEPQIRIVKACMKADPEKISIDEADVIVAGGRGMGNAENFQLLRELAKCLGGVVAGSLPVIDEGWLPRKQQVGQTGMTVSPNLYIACGISGSQYHTLGMKDSKIIIAINKDRNAPIFKVADMGIVGDVLEVVPAIVNKVHELPLTGTGNASTKNDSREV
jgi:electron transfer flavoprotein alpha subunit